MGSSLFPDYTLEKNPYMKLKFWQIFIATKKSTGEKVSVFLFEKKSIDKKTEKEKNVILQLLKKEPDILLKYKNHKNILKIIEPLAEDSYRIGFITEYVHYNLKEWVKEYAPTKFEIKYIIFQLLSIIISLHNDYKISHNNLNIENIFVDNNFFIKISGLNLSTALTNENNNINNNNNLTKEKLELFCDLKYCSPELILLNDININSDNFSIGLISYYLLKNEDLYFLMDNTFNSFKNTYENTKIEKKIKKFNDDNIEEFLMHLLNTNHEKRKNLLSLQNSNFFKESDNNTNDNKLITLCLLSKMESVELSKNYELLKQLPNLFNIYSSKEKELFILPNLLYYLKKENLINPIIPSLFLLCEQKNSKINFSEKIWPHFKFLFNMKKLPAAALYLILKKLSFFSKNLDKSEFNKYCIPLICKALDCGVQKIQEVILDELPNILNELETKELKENIYNKLINIAIKTQNTKLKIRIMNFWNNLCDYFDSYFINNNFLDDIDKIVKNETTLDICKNALILYEKLETKVNYKSVRSKIIPTLLLMMCNGKISEDLFNKGEKIINKFIKKIKESRKDEFIQEINDDKNNENDSDEIKESNLNNEEKKEKNNFNMNSIKNEIGINSPLSISKTKSNKSYLSGNICFNEYNSSEDSNLEIKKEIITKNKDNKIIKKTKNKTKEKKFELNNNYNNINNDNLLDTLLMDDKSEGSDNSGTNDKSQSKNILKYVDKKEYLSSLELKQVEVNKNNIDNNILIKDKKEEKDNSKEKKVNKSHNLWEEIESDDENNNKIEQNKFIKKKKKSGSIKEKNKEKENKIEKTEKINDKIIPNKKWDEDEDDEDINNNINDNNNIKIAEKDNDNPLLNKVEEKIINENINNNTENKDTSDININNSKHKKIKKKKKKKKDNKTNSGEKINNIENKEKEKENEDNKSSTKMNMEKRAANINLESLLDD